MRSLFISIIGIVALITGILIWGVETSEIKTELGVVVGKAYSPEFDGSGLNTGVSTNGNMTIGTHNIHKDEQFLTIFTCEHNTIFSVNDKKVYITTKEKDSVTISYKEVYFFNRFLDYQFISAEKIRKK